MSVSIVVHTHSEYSFLWKAAIPLLEKYAPDYTIYWLCDTLLDYTLPPNFIPCFYEPKLLWSTRVRNCLEKISSEYILYFHEDCLATGPVEPEKINYCIEFMKEKECSFLMNALYSPESPDILHDGIMPKLEKSMYKNYSFAKITCHYLHPAIWKKSLLNNVVETDYHFRRVEQPEINAITREHNLYAVVNTQCVEASTATLYYPHIHAINWGNWTFTKYPQLKELAESYGIDTSTRGSQSGWLVAIKCSGVCCREYPHSTTPTTTHTNSNIVIPNESKLVAALRRVRRII